MKGKVVAKQGLGENAGEHLLSLKERIKMLLKKATMYIRNNSIINKIKERRRQKR